VQIEAARLVEHGAPLVVQSVELAEPASGTDEVVVEMSWGGVNPVDRYAALGLAAPDGPVPRTLGTEGSGTVDGSPVVVHGSGVGTARDGLWASKAVVPRSAITQVPDGVDLASAGAIGVAGATAWCVVNDLAAVSGDDRVLVLGASGGVGSMIVSLCHSIGATVWGQTSAGTNSSWVAERGADHVVVVDAGELVAQGRDLEPTVVFDPLGDGFTGEAIKLMAPRGRLVLFGTSAGASGEVPLQMLYRKGLTLYGYAGLIASVQTLALAKQHALQAVADGRMHVSVGATIPLADVNQAFEHLVNRDVQGKILLDLRS
jgi:NADPH2:quinone reductase